MDLFEFQDSAAAERHLFEHAREIPASESTGTQTQGKFIPRDSSSLIDSVLTEISAQTVSCLNESFKKISLRTKGSLEELLKNVFKLTATDFDKVSGFIFSETQKYFKDLCEEIINKSREFFTILVNAVVFEAQGYLTLNRTTKTSEIEMYQAVLGSTGTALDCYNSNKKRQHTECSTPNISQANSNSRENHNKESQLPTNSSNCKEKEVNEQEILTFESSRKLFGTEHVHSERSSVSQSPSAKFDTDTHDENREPLTNRLLEPKEELDQQYSEMKYEMMEGNDMFETVKEGSINEDHMLTDAISITRLNKEFVDKTNNSAAVQDHLFINTPKEMLMEDHLLKSEINDANSSVNHNKTFSEYQLMVLPEKQEQEIMAAKNKKFSGNLETTNTGLLLHNSPLLVVNAVTSENRADQYLKGVYRRGAICLTCGHRFYTLAALKSHQRTYGHSVEACERCGKYVYLYEDTHYCTKLEECNKSLKSRNPRGVSKSRESTRVSSHGQSKPVCNVCGVLVYKGYSLCHRCRFKYPNKRSKSRTIQEPFTIAPRAQDHDVASELHEPRTMTAKLLEDNRQENASESKSDENEISKLQPTLRTVQRKYGPGRLYKCELCNRGFPAKKHLYKHEKSAHIVGDQYACSFCGMCFSFRRLLVSHVRTHTTSEDTE